MTLHHTRPAFAGLLALVASLLVLPQAVLSNGTVNAPIELEPRVAQPNHVVELHGMVCLASDGSGPRPLDLDAFWLVDTEAAPPWNTAHLTEPGDWYEFDAINSTSTDASVGITVPNRRAGEYVLWWRCGGPLGGWHYSTGPTLVIKPLPNTDAALSDRDAGADRGTSQHAVLLIAVAALTCAAALFLPRRRS